MFETVPVWVLEVYYPQQSECNSRVTQIYPELAGSEPALLLLMFYLQSHGYNMWNTNHTLHKQFNKSINTSSFQTEIILVSILKLLKSASICTHLPIHSLKWSHQWSNIIIQKWNWALTSAWVTLNKNVVAWH